MTYASVIAADSPTWWWRCNEAGGQLGQATGSGQASALTPGYNSNTVQPYVSGGFGYTGIAADGGSLLVGSKSAFTAELQGTTLPVGFAVEAWVCAPSIGNAFAETSLHSVAFLSLMLHGSPYVVLGGFNTSLFGTATIGTGAGSYSCGGAVAMNNGLFHHLVVGVGSGGAAFYVDGVSSFPGTGTFPTQSTHDFQLLLCGLSTLEASMVCEVAIYTGGLTSGQVAAHYAARELIKRPTWRQGLPSVCT